jgi:ABC-type maltose transport system permease subunit
MSPSAAANVSYPDACRVLHGILSRLGAIPLLLGFRAGWTEFILAWLFISDPSRITLAMGLYSMQGEYSIQIPWSDFAAMSIPITIPVVVVVFLLQRRLVSGLAVGTVKG